MTRPNNVRPIDSSARYEDRPVGAIVHELAAETRSFVATRAEMFVSEMRENLSQWKAAFPMMMIGTVFAVSAWLVLTAALIAAIWVAFEPNPFAVFFACLIVGCGYLIFGAMLIAFGRRAIHDQPLFPKRTLRVLREDSKWFQQEANTK